MNHEDLMREAIREAERAVTLSEIPVGAIVLSPEGEIIGRGYNRRETDRDPVAHAEIVAMRQAAQDVGTWRLDGCTLIVTLEPCAMCAGAIAQSRLSHLIFGAWDEKAGAVGSVWDILRDPRAIYKVEVHSGVLESDCAALLSTFFNR